MLFTALPTDILILILETLTLQDLVALALTSKLLNSWVSEFGWSAYLRGHPRSSFSLSQSRKTWSSHAQVHYNCLTDRSWSRSEFVARPLSKPWPRKMQPVMAISPSRLVIAAGSGLSSYGFGVSGHGEAPSMRFEGSYVFAQFSTITSMTFINDGGLDETVCLGFQDGALRQVSLKFPSVDEPVLQSLGVTESWLLQLRGGDYIESLSSEHNVLLTLSSSGAATLTNLHFASTQPENVSMNTRSWASHLCLDSSGPYAAFGTSSTQPLPVYSIRNGGLSQFPAATLHARADSNALGGKRVSTAVYGISQAPLSSPWGASPQILVSGWFDGHVRCHDLRSCSRACGFTEGAAPLNPVLTMKDPLQLESFYSVSCGGGSSSHVAAGSARHSVVSFWDVRFPSAGWSVHAPGNDPSPVYDVILESSRLYGTTQSRPFVYDFGSGINSSTYPELPEGRGVDGLKRKKNTNRFGYYVTTYHHRGSLNES